MKPRINITESFGWLSPEAFDLHSIGKNTIKIKGIAVPAGATSKNKRKYVEEELVRAARTLIGKPITINHDPNRIIGNVEWAEHEDGLTEYLATIKKQPYVDMLRDHNKDILGVSVEADYLHNKCTICGQRFYSEESFRDHMLTEHLIKEGVTAPHGMNYKALSLVVAPEIPGVSSTTVELMETWGLHPLSQLLETVTKDKQNQQAWETKMKDKIVLQPENRNTIDRIKEQTEEQLPTPEQVSMDKPEPVAADNEQPPAHPTSEPGQECGEGSHWDEVSGTCIPDEPHEESPPQNSPPIGPSVGETDQLKVTPPLPVEPEPPAPQLTPPEAAAPENVAPSPQKADEPGKECTEGSHWDEEACACIPDPIIAVQEIKFPEPLKLGEPFANYDSFDACVSANQDKDDPEAYCASLENKVEKQPASEIWSPQRGHIRDIKLATTINKQSKKLEEIYTYLSKALKEAEKPLLTEAKIRASTTKQLKQRLTEIMADHTAKAKTLNNQLKETKTDNNTLKELLDKNTKAQTTELAKLSKAHNDTVTFLTNKLTEICTSIKKASITTQTVNNKLTESTNQIKALETQFANTKKSYETILEAVDKRYGELKDNTKTLEDRIKEQEDELEKRKWKLTETVEQLSTKYTNLESKLKGTFKAHSPQTVKETRDNPPVKDKMRTGN